MSYHDHTNWNETHQVWEDLSSAVIGGLVLISPLYLAVGAEIGGAVIICTGTAGFLIAMLGLLEWVRRERWQILLELLAGAWVAVSPFILQYGGNLRTWHLVLGGAVMTIALFKYRKHTESRHRL